MPTAKNRWIKKIATHRARLHARRLMTLSVGAALWFGGASEAFDGVHFLVEKDLDRVNVVRRKGGEQAVVASLEGRYTSNSVFKLARILPDRYVSQQANLFQDQWLPIPVVELIEAEKIQEKKPERQTTVETLAQDFSLINDRIQAEFFKTIPFGELIHRKARKYDVDPALVAAVIEQESRFRPRANHPSAPVV